METIEECTVRNIRFGKTTMLASTRLYYVIAAVVFQLVVFLWVIRQIARAGSLILHAHDFNTLLGCTAARRLSKDRVRLVYDCHEFTPGVYEQWYGSLVSGIVGRLEFAALSQVDGIVAANEAIRSHICRRSKAPAIVIYCCPAILEIPQIEPLDAKKRLGLFAAFVVLFSGRARQDYDLDLILGAARDFRRNGISDFRFVFTGPEETMAPLRNAAVDGGVRDLLDFRGWVADEELLLYYLASDLCFAVTRDLGPNTRVLTPIKLFESMACGVPVAVRSGTLAAEIVQKWGCGVIIQNARTPFSAELMHLKDDQQLLHALGRAGKKAFLTAYNWDQMQAKLLRLYCGLEFARSKG